LPFGVRQLIHDFAFSFGNKTLRQAVQLWWRYRAFTKQLYGNINDWDVSGVTNMDDLFRHTSFNDRIDRWDVRNVTSMDCMFFGAMVFNQPLDTWDVRQVTNMQHMFYEAASFNQPLSTWDVSRVTDMQFMFAKAYAFNQPLTTWDVHNVSDLSNMFCEAIAHVGCEAGYVYEVHVSKRGVLQSVIGHVGS
jgi:MoxR-like ATPase